MSEPEGIFARIPLIDMTLAEACDKVADKGAWFYETRILVLYHFSQVTVNDYWDLSVGDHRSMVDFLVDMGFYGHA